MAINVNTNRRLKVFLCHGSEDKPAVRQLYRDLREDGVDPWLDEVNILPGMDWDLEIRKNVKSADAILVCLSSKSVKKEGYVQKEVKLALDAADEKPDGTIFMIPMKLDDCEVPERLAKWQWATVDSSDYYRLLIAALRERGSSLGLSILPGDGQFDLREYPIESESGKVLYKARDARDLLRRFKNRELYLSDVPLLPSETVVGITVEAVDEIQSPFSDDERKGKELEDLLRLAGIQSPCHSWTAKNAKVYCFRNYESEVEAEGIVEFIPVTSSNIASIGYDETKSSLYVEFKSGSLYEYYEAPKDLFERFLNANSKGKFLHAYIRDRYHYRQIR